MESISTIVEPFASPLNTQFYGLIILAVLGAGLCFLLMTKRLASNFKLAGLFGMLLGFVGLIAAGTVVFSYVHSRTIQPINFSSSDMQYSNQTILYKQIERHYVKPLIQQSRYSAQINTDTALVYVIEMRDKRLHLFSNEYYNVKNLKKVMETYVPKK